MRINVNAPILPIWPAPAQLRDVVGADTLAAARLEPVYTRRSQGAFGLDLIFAKGARVAAIPGIRVAHEMLVEPEMSALLWPAEVAEALDAATIDAVEGRVMPWLLAQTLARQVNGEIVRLFGDLLDPADYERARAAGFAGAARYTDAAVAAAPYVYAQRFARGASVGIAEGCAATGAALLARSARSVRADLGDEELSALACRWFGLPIFGALDGEAEVGIGVEGSRVTLAFEERQGWRSVRVAAPVPTEIFISFDPQDSPPVRSFSVLCKRRIAPRESMLAQAPSPVGGSSGRVLVLVPAESQREAQADADDARELARRLRAEGFLAHLSGGAGIDAAQYDLVHAFSLGHAREFIDLLRGARANGIPIVATAGLAAGAGQRVWGARLGPAILSRYQDENARAEHLNLLALRRLGDVNADPGQAEPFAGYSQSIRAALELVDALIVSGAEEEAYVRSEFGYTGPVSYVQAYVEPETHPAPIDEVAGTGRFALCHAAIHPLSNQGFLVRAARRAGIPLVLAGPVTDPLYYGLLREDLDGSAILWPEPTHSELSALYRRASVFADVAWSGTSLHRLARAAAGGCAIVASGDSYAAKLWPGVRACDVADAASIEAALRDAWDSGAPGALAASAAAGIDPQAVLHATVSAYARAQQSRSAVGRP